MEDRDVDGVSEDICGDAYGGGVGVLPDNGEDGQISGSPLCIAQGLREKKERQEHLCHLLI